VKAVEKRQLVKNFSRGAKEVHQERSAKRTIRKKGQKTGAGERGVLLKGSPGTYIAQSLAGNPRSEGNLKGWKGGKWKDFSRF